MRDAAERFLPLKPVMFHILLSLVDGERHGYGLVRDIAARTAGRMRIEPANLYRTLGWMLDAGLVEASERRDVGGDERRRFYRVTRLGLRVAEAEASRLNELVREARARRLVKTPRRA
jgi:DNA-binding PadR family transcriptional regulator